MSGGNQPRRRRAASCRGELTVARLNRITAKWSENGRLRLRRPRRAPRPQRDDVKYALGVPLLLKVAQPPGEERRKGDDSDEAPDPIEIAADSGLRTATWGCTRLPPVRIASIASGIP